MRLIVKGNDDLAILEYLADLEDRNPIRTLEMLLQENRKKQYFIIDYHKKEKFITILLYNAPFEVNENGNVLMLFVHNDLTIIADYFKRLMGITDYKDKEKRTAVRQVLNLIDYYLQNHEELFKKPQISNAEK